MSKSKVIVLSIGVIAVAAIAFSQLNQPEPVKQVNKDSKITAPVSKAMPQAVQQSKPVESQSALVTDQANNSATDDKQSVQPLAKKRPVQERQHDLPADHQRANSQARQHGHESHNHGEQNAPRPPGEPKKPVPSQEAPSTK
ncbi:MAG: hypothetical protein MJK12_17510 [Colwellia sp.]|nr:hypothetical protein [Colwellia sp.]